MLAVFVFQDDGYGKGTCFDTKEDLFEYVLDNHGPDCRLEKGLWLGGCGSPDDGLGTIIGFSSDQEFNSQFQKHVEKFFFYSEADPIDYYSGILCPHCEIPEHSCCCYGCVETY